METDPHGVEGLDTERLLNYKMEKIYKLYISLGIL